MAEPTGQTVLAQWRQQADDELLYHADDVRVERQEDYDSVLIAWLLRLADQGSVTTADLATFLVHDAPVNLMLDRPDLAAVLFECTAADLLAMGQLLQYWRDDFGWPVPTFPLALATVCQGRSLRAGIQALASLWREHGETWRASMDDEEEQA